jgi:hypothetical protein
LKCETGAAKPEIAPIVPDRCRCTPIWVGLDLKYDVACAIMTRRRTLAEQEKDDVTRARIFMGIQVFSRLRGYEYMTPIFRRRLNMRIPDLLFIGSYGGSIIRPSKQDRVKLLSVIVF